VELFTSAIQKMFQFIIQVF